MSAATEECQVEVYVQSGILMRGLNSGLVITGSTSMNLHQYSLFAYYHQGTLVMRMMCRGKEMLFEDSLSSLYRSRGWSIQTIFTERFSFQGYAEV